MRKRGSLVKALVVWAIVGLLMGAGVGVYVKARGNGKKAPVIKTADVMQGSVISSVTVTGVLQPTTVVEVKSNAGGEILEMAVDEGDRVEAGQLIARIDPEDTMTTVDQTQADLTSARSRVTQAEEQLAMQQVSAATQLTQAEEALKSAKLRLQQAEDQAKIQPMLTASNIEQAASGLVSAQSALSQLKSAGAPQRLLAAQAAADQANADYDFAEKEHLRQQELLSQGFISKKQADTAEQAYRNAKSRLATAEQKLDTVQSELDADIRSAEAKVRQAEASLSSAKANRVQDRIKLSDVESAKAAVKQAEASLASAKSSAGQVTIKRGDITQAQASLAKSQATAKSARTQLGYTTITAPRAGVILKRYVEAGTIVSGSRNSLNNGAVLVDLADMSQVEALVNVDETDIGKIRVGQDVEVTADAFPDELYGGKVMKIAPNTVTAQSVTTVPVTVAVKVNDLRLRPGMNVNCEFVTQHVSDVLYVPSEAIKQSGRSSTVQVREADGTMRTVEVRTGLEGNATTEITDGDLKVGDKVVTSIIDPSKTRANPFTSGRSSGPMGGGGPMGGPPR